MSRHPNCQSPDCPRCGKPMEFEPSDGNYGADADGNRGVYVAAYWYCGEESCEDVTLPYEDPGDDYEPEWRNDE